MIRIYDTMAREKRPFVPCEEGKVGMYVCGPTVYNYIHIGNARTFISFDTIRRYLMWRGYEVTFVQNITDVDDKIINKALEEAQSAQKPPWSLHTLYKVHFRFLISYANCAIL